MTVHAIRCPQCSAVLDVQAGASLVRCGFCSTPCRVDWRGNDPVATEEAEEVARLLDNIDFDALEQGLKELEEYVDQQNARDELASSVARLGTSQQVDHLAAQLAASGKAHEFMQGVSNLEIDESEEHEVLLRNLLARVAVRAATQSDGVETRTPQLKDNVLQQSGAAAVRTDAYRAGPRTGTETASPDDFGLDEQLERKAKRWLWLPWVGLLLLPLVVIGLAFVLTIAIAILLPQHDQRPWLGWAFGVAVLTSPVAGLIWLWSGLKRRRSLVAQRRTQLDRAG